MLGFVPAILSGANLPAICVSLVKLIRLMPVGLASGFDKIPSNPFLLIGRNKALLVQSAVLQQHPLQIIIVLTLWFSFQLLFIQFLDILAAWSDYTLLSQWQRELRLSWYHILKKNKLFAEPGRRCAMNQVLGIFLYLVNMI